MKISFFGHFGQGNFGNEITLQAILYHLRRMVPNAEVTCICTGPETVGPAYNIAAVPIGGAVFKPWAFRTNPLARLVRKIFVGIPSELYRCLRILMTLRNTDLLIVPGTGLLTDAYGLFNWGPYSMFKWSALAKLCHCKLFFVSVGAGPISGAIGRCLVKSTLSLADFRSYREKSTVQYLKSIGFRAENDPIYPDLAFSLPEAFIPHEEGRTCRRVVVGVGLMDYNGMYGTATSNVTYTEYLANLTTFVKWLLAHEYSVRLLIGDISDKRVAQDFKSMLAEQLTPADQRYVIDEPAACVEQLLLQLADTDIVVATRFHNIILALLVNIPVLSIAFHHKCFSLMSSMGLSEYCQDIKDLTADRLIEQFCHLQKNAESLKPMIRQRAEVFRKALDVQYKLIFQDLRDPQRAEGV
jgi:polysaccharide pyruvyl transferase WcaK-like protein